MHSPPPDSRQDDYLLQAITPSGSQIHIFCHRNVIKHKHKGYLADDERTAYQEALMWLEQQTIDGLHHAMATLDRNGVHVMLVR